MKNFDTELLKFEVVDNIAEPKLNLLWVNKSKRNLFPLDLDVTSDGISHWIRKRNIPKNRAFVDSFLSKQGLSINRPIGIIKVSKGLSLNDTFWIVEEGFKGKFKDYNLYDNKFSSILALIAFTGYGSTRTGFSSSPEFTTDGMLPKCWRRINGKICLYKGFTSGTSNAGHEATSEMLAYQVGKTAKLNVIKYTLQKWKKIGDNPCSVCELFTNKKTSYMPIGRIVKSGGLQAVRKYCKGLGEKFEKALNEMIVFDAIICNTDRHFGNFGLLIDSKSNKIKDFAPLFDHGNSMFNFAGRDAWGSIKEFDKYVKTLMPSTYDDFIVEAKKCLDKDIKEKVRKLFRFRITRNKKLVYNEQQLKMIENKIRERARLILE